MILLSLITVVYNDSRGLERTISSIDEAVMPLSNILNVEHLIVDGGSTDGFVELTKDLCSKRAVSTFIISEPDEGIYDAMNKGVLYARGEGVLFLNAGDEIHPCCSLDDVLQSILCILPSRKVAGLAYYSTMKIGRRELLIKSRRVSKNYPRMPGIHQAMIYKRPILLSVPFDTNFVICGDYDNFARIVTNYGYFVPVERTFARFHAGGLSSKSPRQLMRESFYISNTHFGLNIINKVILTLRLIISISFLQIVLFFEKKYLD